MAASDYLEDGKSMLGLAAELYPICRSITGDGLRQSLRVLQKVVPLELREVPTGTRVFDWEVPREWNIRDAYIKNLAGTRVIDFQASNLHVVNYSIPVKRTMRLPELRAHLFSLPDAPQLIPYRTSYYQESWGFCLSHDLLQRLPDEEYEVCIDSTLESGSMTFGELRLAGDLEHEILISAHSCHPSLCNDNLSSMIVAAHLARRLSAQQRRYSYRFLWVPATIGSLAWLAANESTVPNIKHGLVLSCVGDPGRFTYKRSRHGTTEIDRAVELVLRDAGCDFEMRDFTPYGCDERQYCSPGFNLPVGCFMRTPNEEYPENHTSADNLDFIQASALAESLDRIGAICGLLERNQRYLNLYPKGEPQLGHRGLYGQAGGKGGRIFQEAVMWVLNLSDGEHSLMDIAERSKLRFQNVADAAEVLVDRQLIRKLD